MRNKHMWHVIADSIVKSDYGNNITQDIENALRIEWHDAIEDILEIVMEHYVKSTDADYQTKMDRGYGACAQSILRDVKEYQKKGLQDSV